MKQNKIFLLLSAFIIWLLLYIELGFISNLLVYSILGMEPGQKLTDAIWFFVYEVPKVLLLLTLVVFVVGIIRTYFSPERTRKMLGGKRLFTGNILAGLLGVVTPFSFLQPIEPVPRPRWDRDALDRAVVVVGRGHSRTLPAKHPPTAIFHALDFISRLRSYGSPIVQAFPAWLPAP